VLLECTGSESLTSDAIRALRPAGAAVLVGMGPGLEARVPIAALQAREITLVGTFRYANTYAVAIALARAGRVDLDGLVDAHFPLEDVDRALRAGREEPDPVEGCRGVTVLVLPARRTFDQAPWVPLVNPRSVDVLSKRVGNYQHSPAGLGMLIDQLWVR
jgi:hypothetical protein